MSLLGGRRDARAGRAGSTTRPRACARRRPGRRPRSAAARVTPRPRAYSRARRISAPSWTPVPSSVNSRTPSAASSAMRGEPLARRPTVMAPATAHLGRRAPRPRSSTSRADRRVVDGRLGVGHGHHRGEPAERRPARPVSTVSASSRARLRAGGCAGRPARAPPGSPPASSTIAPAGTSRSGPTADTVPPRTRTSARRSSRTVVPAPSMTVPPRITTVARASATTRLAAIPARREPSARAAGTAPPCAPRPRWSPGGSPRHGQVGHVGGDLHAADHRAGVGDDRRRSGEPRHPPGGQPPAGRVLAQRGDEGTAPPLAPAGAAGRRRRRSRSASSRSSRNARPASPRATAAGGCRGRASVTSAPRAR